MASAHAATSASVCSGVGVGREVEIVTATAQQHVADRPADDVQLVPGGPEALPELVGDGEDPAAA
jgi:hypothetical protein